MIDLDPISSEPVHDTEIEINLRPAADVARRVIILSAVCTRAYLELARTTRLDFAAAEAERFDLLAWLDHESLGATMTERERHLLASHIRKISKQAAIEASWQIEALALLAWALDLLPVAPRYIGPFESTQFLTTFPEPPAKTAPLIETAHLRSLAEIATERERAELWYWRANLTEELGAASGSERKELHTTLAQVTAEATLAGLIPTSSADDFAVDGRPYAELSPEVHAILAAVAANRLHALNWLCGFGPDWDSVPLDV